MQKKLHLVSLGCTKNLVDSEVMLGRLREYEITDDSTQADVIIVNTCGFIDAAKEESINTVLSLHDERKKNSILVMSGCLSERYKEELQADMPEIDIFTGVGDYEKIDQLIASKQSTFSPEVYLATENSGRVITGSNYHAYIKIAEGCNQSCSFCAIPSFKGKLHSRSLSSVLKEVENLVAQGFYDFSFISQDSSSYGRDMKMADGLIELIKGVEAIEGVISARILYLYPSTTTFALIDAIADSKVFQTYYDMPIQHIDDGVLKVMKRGFGEKKTIELLEYMKSKPGAFLRTSLIAGHPGESDESFEKLCAFMKTFEFDRFNTFGYSNEETTSAYTLEQVDQETIDERAEKLGMIAEENTLTSLQKMVGKTIILVVDGESDEHEYLLTARPLGWAVDIDGEILINDTSDLAVEYGKRYEATITELVGTQLLATLIRPSH
ncbi:MAG TPA: 30S ribosomal protein S12 methylthiotransferase RimO [Sulfurovum sp.]|nr:MAG: ribosomal protein S12 methylthiotransferase RimO [Sulfurovum sp. 35-42-20]OYZ24819.1 MAG: ribosomal protein S12 methylthiotransferase RimO [Sulfurovum sp. 16-42-52]OYZ49307.1 MAG: ribosomal protein S12 methylthiotransferase RimO [Sulfurovum sp. 24-42-9]OZA44782.1 MAG: ribosomal protein S12 methylthiotransferase RimO [Sulfurovum sp. 17-42-90]OZA59469.1 MAG: ribosomal protein S12 methylthiotransferase RimO [Sulfurovum sp. 39-42-12]HQR73936.1 30S ribosomal protein S12 methylthiotransferas